MSEGPSDDAAGRAPADQTAREGQPAPAAEAERAPTAPPRPDAKPGPDPALAALGRRLGRAGTIFPSAPGASAPPSYDLTPLTQWRDADGDVPSSATPLPDEPGLHILHAADIRAIAADLRAIAGTADRAFDLGLAVSADHRARQDPRSLLALLEAQANSLAGVGRLAFYPGERGSGSDFWDEDVDVEAVAHFCKDRGLILFLAAVGARGGAFAGRIGAAHSVDVDALPLVLSLAARCPSVAAEQIIEIWPTLLRTNEVASLIEALDSQVTEDIEERLETARRGEPLARAAGAFIETHLAGGDAAAIALTFSAAVFGPLPAGELQRIAHELVQVPGLAGSQAADGTRAPVPPVSDGARARLGIVPRSRPGRYDSVRVSLMMFRQGRGFTEALRGLLAEDLAMTSALLVHEISRCLLHGAVGPDAWRSACQIVGRVLVDGGEQTLNAIADRIAAFWLGDCGPEPLPAGPPDRRARLAADDGRALEDLCAAAATTARLNLRRLQARVAAALIPRSGATSAERAWRAPVAANFLLRVLSDADDIEVARELLLAGLDGPGEILTLALAMTTGGFGCPMPLVQNQARLDQLLTTAIALVDGSGSGSEDDGVHDLAAAMVWRLAPFRVSHDGARLARSQPADCPSALAAGLLQAAATLRSVAISDRLELATDLAAWMETERFDHLALGWRAPPAFYREAEPHQRAELLAGESAYLMVSRLLAAITGDALDEAEQDKAVRELAHRLGLPPDAQAATAALWMPEALSAIESLGCRSLLDDGAAVHDGTDPGDSQFRALLFFIAAMAELRQSALILASACAQTTAVTSDGNAVSEASLAPLDRKHWSALSDARKGTQDLLVILYDAWRNTLSGYRRSPAMPAALAWAMIPRKIVAAWWSALQLGQQRSI